MKFISYVLKTFVSTLCCNNDDDYDLFKVVKCYFIEDVIELNVISTILHKKNDFSKLIRNDNLLSNKGFKSMFITIKVWQYHA